MRILVLRRRLWRSRFPHNDGDRYGRQRRRDRRPAKPAGALPKVPLALSLLIAPPATASLLARRVPAMMTVSVSIGMLSVYAGLLCSYHFDLAAGAAMAGFAVAAFFVVLTVTETAKGMRSRATGASPTSRPDQLADGVGAAEGAPRAARGAAGD